MNTKKKLLGYYNYTVILTYIGMLSGFIGIIFSCEANHFAAALCLIFAGFCDMFDGAIASTRKRTEQEKAFGIQIDSLSDLVCFGVFPAVFVYTLNIGNYISLAVSAVYLLAALIRLAFFNVDEWERQKNSTGKRTVYLGMPVTFSAVFVPFFYGLGTTFGWCATGIILTVLLGAMALLYLLPFKMKKPNLFKKISLFVLAAVDIFLVVYSHFNVK